MWTSSFAGEQFHFDGSQWTVTADGANDDLILGMWANTTDDVWAVGYSNILLHWDRHVWAPQAAPPVLRCEGPVVDGYYEEAIGGTPLLFHYDGSNWTDLSPS